jgi:hypothetical protein
MSDDAPPETENRSARFRVKRLFPRAKASHPGELQLARSLGDAPSDVNPEDSEWTVATC